MPDHISPPLPALAGLGLPPLLNAHEVAELLRISESHLRNMRIKGEGPAFIKLPTGAIRYTVEAVQEWIGGQQ